MMKPVWAGILAIILAGPAAAQIHVSFPTSDAGLVFADQYGRGDRGVVLAHGGRFDKESWRKQAPLRRTGRSPLSSRNRREVGKRCGRKHGG